MFSMDGKRSEFRSSRISLLRLKRLPHGLATACCLSSACMAAAYQESFTFTTPAGLAFSAGNIHGVADGTNNSARFYSPAGVVVDSVGRLFVADGSVIRRVVPAGTNWVVTTLAGNPAVNGAADGTNSDALFKDPQGVSVDAAGNLYVADTQNSTIRKVTPVGTNWVVSTLAGFALASGSADGTNTGARFNRPYGIAVGSATNL